MLWAGRGGPGGQQDYETMAALSVAAQAMDVQVGESTATVQLAHSTNIPASAAASPGTTASSSALRVCHISDSHISLETESWRKERVALGLPPEDPMHEGRAIQAAIDNFEEQVALAVAGGVDLIVHTGDFLNLPSEESIAYCKSVLDRSGIPYRYTCGNHDWCYEGLGGDRRSMTSEAGRRAVRDEWREKRLLPLFGESRDPDAWSEDISGLRFVAIDNSTCRVTEAQASFFAAEVAREPRLPVVLLVHVPLYCSANGDDERSLRASMEVRTACRIQFCG
jgi:hypothetical protein